MPAVSKAQQKYMAGCEHNPESMKGSCPSKSVASEFSSTPIKGLPGHVEKKSSGKLKKSILKS